MSQLTAQQADRLDFENLLEFFPKDGETAYLATDTRCASRHSDMPPSCNSPDDAPCPNTATPCAPQAESTV